MVEIASTININDIQQDIANGLIEGIVARLHEAFGDSYTFYAEDVPQGFKTPSFAVISLNPQREYGLGKRRLWKFSFDVHYFCDSKKPRREWRTIEEALAIKLEWIEACNTKLRAEMQPSEYDSDQQVGHFYVTYAMHLIDVYPEPPRFESVVDKPSGGHIGGTCNSESGCPINWR